MVKYANDNLLIKNMEIGKVYNFSAIGEGFCDGYEVTRYDEHMTWKPFWELEDGTITYEEIKGCGPEGIIIIVFQYSIVDLLDNYREVDLNDCTLDLAYNIAMEAYICAVDNHFEFPVGYEDSSFVLNGYEIRLT